MAFQGSLEELPLPDIIQLVSVSGKTGRFDLSSPHSEGQIFLRDGQIVHARTNSLEGEEAIYELAIWEDGEFFFTPDRVSDTTTISKSNTNLLMEAARRIDEWQILSKRISSVHLVPVFSDVDYTSVTFSRAEWRVVRKIDERRTIEEIAIALGASPFDVSKLLYGLSTAGYVELRPDLSSRLGPDLWQLQPDEAHDRISVIHDQALQIFEAKATDASGSSPPGAVLELSRSVQQSIADLNAGRTGTAVLDLARASETLVRGHLGGVEAEAFVAELENVLRTRNGTRIISSGPHAAPTRNRIGEHAGQSEMPRPAAARERNTGTQEIVAGSGTVGGPGLFSSNPGRVR